MEVHEYARKILFGEHLEEKLLDRSVIQWKETDMSYSGATLPEYPARAPKIAISAEQSKFPKISSLHIKERRGAALHFFANHELLAIEMLAAALYLFPCQSQEDLSFKKTLVSTLGDEQKHFSLYLKRMKDFGVNFGDYHLNDFFWKYMKKVQSPQQFLSILALTFESANLDFSRYYEEVFTELGDHETAKIMAEVYADEISHVAVGAYWLKKWRDDRELWDYYRTNLPQLLTPARAKGVVFDRQGRLKAGLDEEFVDQLFAYRDDFKVTNRRQSRVIDDKTSAS